VPAWRSPLTLTRLAARPLVEVAVKVTGPAAPAVALKVLVPTALPSVPVRAGKAAGVRDHARGRDDAASGDGGEVTLTPATGLPPESVTSRRRERRAGCHGARLQVSAHLHQRRRRAGDARRVEGDRRSAPEEAVKLLLPAAVPSVAVALASPLAAEATLAGDTEPPPEAAAKSTVAPSTEFPWASTTRTTKAEASAVPAAALWRSPLTFTSAAAAPALPEAVKVTEGTPRRRR